MREITFVQAIREALSEEMTRDPNVFLIGEDIGRFGSALGQTKGLLETFGEERIRDTPISESAIVGAAIGASLLGMRPIAEIMYTDFSTLAMDQIINQAAKARFMSGGRVTVPLVIRMQSGIGRGKAAQHSQSFESIFAHIPGLKVVMPSTPYDAKGLLKTSIRDDNPVVFIEHGSIYALRGQVPEEDYVIPLGAADIKRSGKDVSIITYSIMVYKSLSAATRIAEQGIDAEVIDLRTLRPLDVETIVRSVKKTHRVVVVHEGCVTGGFAGEVVSRIIDHAFDYLDAPIKRIGLPDVPVPYAKSLEDSIVPSEESIVKSIMELM